MIAMSCGCSDELQLRDPTAITDLPMTGFVSVAINSSVVDKKGAGQGCLPSFYPLSLQPYFSCVPGND